MRAYGQPRGLGKRLADWADRMGRDKSLPWAGLGILEDLKLAAKALNKREWLEALRLSPDPEAHRFADEALADDDTLDAVQYAADRAQMAGGNPGDDPVWIIEQLDQKASALAGDYDAVRAVLVETGALADEDTETPVAGLLRALLS